MQIDKKKPMQHQKIINNLNTITITIQYERKKQKLF